MPVSELRRTKVVVAGAQDVDAICVDLFGDVVVEDITAMHQQVLAHLAAEGDVRYLAVDVTRLTNFSPNVRHPGVPFLTDIRERGVTLMSAVGASGLVRMMAAAIALAAGLPIKFTASHAEFEALVVADALKAGAPAPAHR